jgi:hypothetical protein
LPHGVEVVARDAQKLVAAVDVEHILDAEGNVKPEWRQKLGEYLKQVSTEMVARKATALILGCTHFEYFERDFAKLLPTLAARNGIISPSGALACRLLDAYDDYLVEYPVRPIAGENRTYFAFSGERPPEETFKSLGLNQIVVAQQPWRCLLWRYPMFPTGQLPSFRTRAIIYSKSWRRASNKNTLRGGCLYRSQLNRPAP